MLRKLIDKKKNSAHNAPEKSRKLNKIKYTCMYMYHAMCVTCSENSHVELGHSEFAGKKDRISSVVAIGNWLNSIYDLDVISYQERTPTLRTYPHHHTHIIDKI